MLSRQLPNLAEKLANQETWFIPRRFITGIVNSLLKSPCVSAHTYFDESYIHRTINYSKAYALFIYYLSNFIYLHFIYDIHPAINIIYYTDYCLPKTQERLVWRMPYKSRKICWTFFVIFLAIFPSEIKIKVSMPFDGKYQNLLITCFAFFCASSYRF